jgi:hypothetical protein
VTRNTGSFPTPTPRACAREKAPGFMRFCRGLAPGDSIIRPLRNLANPQVIRLLRLDKWWKIAIVSFSAGVIVTIGFMLLFNSFSGSTTDAGDQKAALAYCKSSESDAPDLIAPCTDALVRVIRLQRQMRR